MTNQQAITSSAARETGAGVARVKLTAAERSGSWRALDGAWWPRSRDLAAEVPGLLEQLERRGVHVTRVTYSPTLWDPAPRRINVADRVVRLGSFATMDAELICLTSGARERRIQLLVVPPETAADLAVDAMNEAAATGNRTNTTDMLGRVGSPTAPLGVDVALPLPRTPPAGEDQPDRETETWDAEGGHARR